MDNQSLLTYNGDEAIVVYQSEDNTLRLDVQMAQDTVWLTQQQIAILFDKAKSTISYHISNVFTEGELDEKVVVRKIRIPTPHGAIEGKTQYDEVNFYNQLNFEKRSLLSLFAGEWLAGGGDGECVSWKS